MGVAIRTHPDRSFSIHSSDLPSRRSAYFFGHIASLAFTCARHIYFTCSILPSWCESPIACTSCSMTGRCSPIPSQNAGLGRKPFGRQDQSASTPYTIFYNNNIIPCLSNSEVDAATLSVQIAFLHAAGRAWRAAWHHVTHRFRVATFSYIRLLIASLLSRPGQSYRATWPSLQ